MSIRFGLDMGTNSIGWAVFDITQPQTPALLDMGVRIFSDGKEPKTGTPLNEERRTARGMRRMRDRRIRRKNAVLRFLMDNGLMPQKAELRAEAALLDPYALRVKALEQPLEPVELGRIMMQFAGRRGFKSSRKDEKGKNDANNSEHAEKAGMLAGVAALTAKLQGKTLGQWLFEQREKGNSVRFTPKIEKNKAVYSFYPSREMYESEFQAIQAKQSAYFPVNWERLHALIFFQRPLKPPERGRCQFYTEEYRGYRAFTSAHRFRILQNIHDLKYYDEENRLHEIPWESKLELFRKLDAQKRLSFNEMRKILGVKGMFNLESERRSELKGNETAAAFRSKEYFGGLWDALDAAKQDEIVEKLLNEDAEKAVFDLLKPLGLSDVQIKKISAYSLQLQTGTVSLSGRFMRECADVMLNEALPYSEAVKKMGLHHSIKEKQKQRRSLPYYGRILTESMSGAKGREGRNDEEKYGRITNPTVHIALNQLRKLINALIRRFGKPDEIIVELARELKNGKERRTELERYQAENQKNNERIREEVKQLGFVSPSHDDIKKYKLWTVTARTAVVRIAEKPSVRRSFLTAILRLNTFCPIRGLCGAGWTTSRRRTGSVTP